MSLSAQEYLRTLADLEAEHQRNVDALQRSWALYNKGIPLPKSINGHADAVATIRGWRQAVNRVIPRMPAQFKIGDVREALVQDGVEQPDLSSLSTYLKKLATDGTLAIVEIGPGRKGNTYKRK